MSDIRGPRAARPRSRAWPFFVSILAGALMVTGCEFRGVHSLPLPGGVSTGPNAHTITVKFADVTNLVPRSAVKVNNVTVGAVTDIELEGWHAKVTCEIKGNVDLPDNAVAKVAQSSLLGAKFVQLAPPAATKGRGRLSSGDTIPLARTGRYPEVEEVLSALSLLLNGGGLEQLRTITKELNAVLDGREQQLQDLLHRLDTFVGALEEQKSEIVRALEGVERLSATLRDQKKVLADAIDKIEPALRVLNKQQDALTKMLVALSDLGDVATEVVRASRADLLANLRNLEPILTQLANSGKALPKALELLLTYPFPSTTRQGIVGDYVNLEITADLQVQTLLNNLLGKAPYAHDPPREARSRQGKDEKGKDSERRRRPQAPTPPTPSGPLLPEGDDGDRQHRDDGSEDDANGGDEKNTPDPHEARQGDLFDLLLRGES